MADLEALAVAMGELEEDSVRQTMDAALEGGASGGEILSAMQKGMDEVGSRFEAGEYFVGDLIFAGELMTELMQKIKPLLAAAGGNTGAKMLLCTVKGDVHDIGKDIVKAMLEAGGFEVLDLGVDVPPQTIVDKIQETGLRIVALSGTLTLALTAMKDTADAFAAAGLRDKVKIIVGGACINEQSAANLGVDAWAKYPQETVTICKGWAAE